jgi:hypothetical protein
MNEFSPSGAVVLPHRAESAGRHASAPWRPAAELRGRGGILPRCRPYRRADRSRQRDGGG